MSGDDLTYLLILVILALGPPLGVALAARIRRRPRKDVTTDALREVYDSINSVAAITEHDDISRRAALTAVVDVARKWGARL